jgi:hypothetical protein
VTNAGLELGEALLARAARPGYAGFEAQLRSSGGCARPVRLVGHVEVCEGGGRRRRVWSTDTEPDGILRKACGNRREAVCAPCAERYRGDACARREESRRYDLPSLVDDVVYSHEVGLAKPDPAAYLLSCARLGVEPAEAVFVDDVPVNVDAAAELGLQALLHRTAGDTIEGQSLPLRLRPRDPARR